MKLTLALLILLSTPLTSFAGDKGGNGGDAVVCRNSEGKIESAELLDYYEGRTKRNIEVADTSAQSLEDFTVATFKKLTRFDASYSSGEGEAKLIAVAISEYLETGKTTNKDFRFTSDTLVDISDSNHLTFKQGCKVEQLAIREEKVYAEDPRYTIQTDILKKLSLRDLKGLVLHEVLYKIKNTDDSRPVRYLNQRFSKFTYENFKFSDYLEIFNQTVGQAILKLGNGMVVFVPAISEKTKRPGDRVLLRVNGLKSTTTTANGTYLVFNKDGQVDMEGTVLYGSSTIQFSYSLSPTKYEENLEKEFLLNDEILKINYSIGKGKLKFGKNHLRIVTKRNSELKASKEVQVFLMSFYDAPTYYDSTEIKSKIFYSRKWTGKELILNFSLNLEFVNNVLVLTFSEENLPSN